MLRSGSQLMQLYKGKVVAQYSKGEIALSAHGNKTEEVRKYMNTFAKILDLPFTVYSDWVVVYKQMEFTFQDNMRLK